MNAVEPPQVFFRSMATRGSSEVPEALDDAIAACRAAGFDLVIVETPGIGQGDAGIVEHCDVSLYVMTPEFGAASQLEKIDMLDFADAVVINKFERRGAEDALRDVRRQLARNRELFGVDPESLPVFGTIASRFNDDGVTALYQHLRTELAERGLRVDEGRLPAVDGQDQLEGGVDRAARPHALPGRGRRGGAGPPRHHRRAGAGGAPRAAAPRRPRRAAPTEAAATDDLDAALADAQSARRRRDPVAARRLAGRRGRAARPCRVASRSRATSCPGWRSPATRTPASCSGSSAPRTCRDGSRSPPGCSRSSARARTRPGCSPARATPSAPTGASTC